MKATAPTSRTSALLTLVPIVAVAFGLRFWGIDYGIPHPTARPDEERIVGRAQTIFATGEWHPGSFYYPSFLYYADTFALYGYYGVKKLAGDYERPFDLLFEIAVTRPGLHYRIARFVSLVFGVATVLAAYALGVSAFRRRSVGLLAALGVAVCHVHVRDSHFATVDIPTTLFATLSLVFAARVAASPSTPARSLTRNAVASGLFAGLAASTKYNVGIVAVAVVVALFRTETGLSFKARRLAMAALSAMAAFAATSPFVVRRFGAFWNDIGFLEGFLYGSSESPLALWGHLQTTLPAGLGWPLFALGVVGVVRAALRRSDTDLVLLAFLIPFFVLIASVRLTFPRYVLPVVPALIVLGAETAVWLLGRLPDARPGLAWAGLTLLLAGPPLWSSIAFDRLAARPDTRLQAARFIAENVAPQTKILVCRGYGAPFVNQDRRRPPAHRVEEVDCFSSASIAAAGARFLVTHEHRELTSFSRVHPELARWLETNLTEVASFDPYRLDASAKPSPTPYFYRADAFYIPFTGFSALTRGGPLVRIWELPSDD